LQPRANTLAARNGLHESILGAWEKDGSAGSVGWIPADRTWAGWRCGLGHAIGENSLNPHFLGKHSRGISTPRPSASGCRFSAGAPLNMTEGKGLEWHENLREKQRI